MCIDTDKIEDSITKKTKVILPVHFGGMACNLDKIISIMMENDLKSVISEK